LRNRSFNRDVRGELSALTYPEEPVLKVGLKDEVKGARKDLFELEQQARVPDAIKRLSDVKKDTPAILSSLKGRGNGIRDAEALLDSRVEGSETKLVGGDDLLRFEDRKKALEEEPLEYFGEKREKTNWPVRGWVIRGFIGLRDKGGYGKFP
jgi:hypothetical protein